VFLVHGGSILFAGQEQSLSQEGCSLHKKTGIKLEGKAAHATNHYCVPDPSWQLRRLIAGTLPYVT